MARQLPASRLAPASPAPASAAPFMPAAFLPWSAPVVPETPDLPEPSRAMTDVPASISFQGTLGAYSHQACVEAFPELAPLPCNTFEGAVAAVKEGRARLAMLPVENSTYGRVADIHHLLPESGLGIVGEHFLRVHIALLGVPGATLPGIRAAMSHTVLLGQCRAFLEAHGIERRTGPDTAGSAEIVARTADPSLAALASDLAGEIYGLVPLAREIEDQSNNTTRFLAMAPEARRVAPGATPSETITSFVFRVRNIPAALYKAMGGFATNGVNMVKLESYMVEGHFTATQFYADIEGHPDEPPVARALEELAYFTSMLQVLGVYRAHPYRQEQAAAESGA
jgi:prephenate dehydratase